MWCWLGLRRSVNWNRPRTYCTQPEPTVPVVPQEILSFQRWTKDRDDPLVYLYDKERDGHVCLVGTNHRAPTSPKVVREVIRLVEPDCVVVELCKRRAKQLLWMYNSYFAFMEDRSNTPFLFAWPLLRRGQMEEQRIAKSKYLQDNLPGRDLYVAMEEAERIGASIVLGDRPESVTIKRVIAEKRKEPISELLSNLFKVEKLAALVEERDVILLNSLKNKAQGKKIVGVVGMYHLAGIQQYWDSLETRIEELGMDKEDLF